MSDVVCSYCGGGVSLGLDLCAALMFRVSSLPRRNLRKTASPWNRQKVEKIQRGVFVK